LLSSWQYDTVLKTFRLSRVVFTESNQCSVQPRCHLFDIIDCEKFHGSIFGIASLKSVHFDRKKINQRSGDEREPAFLFQCISALVQWCNECLQIIILIKIIIIITWWDYISDMWIWITSLSTVQIYISRTRVTLNSTFIIIIITVIIIADSCWCIIDIAVLSAHLYTVCLSHSSIISKWLNTSSYFLQHVVGQSL